MSQGDMLRMRNKHRKVLLKTLFKRGLVVGNSFRVLKTTNTLEPKIGETLTESEVQIIMDKGLTVTVTGR